MSYAKMIIEKFMNIPFAEFDTTDWEHGKRCAVVHIEELISNKRVTIYQLESNLLDIPHSKDAKEFCKQEIKNIKEEIKELGKDLKEVKKSKPHVHFNRHEPRS